jgi:hypothetical protein
VPRWLVVGLVPVGIVLAIAVHDAVGWVGRPFPGFLFLDSRIVVSIGRGSWRPAGLRPVEWAVVTAVDGRPLASADAVHAAAQAAGEGAVVTYTLRRGADVFRVAIPVRRFTGSDFAVVFAPLLMVGAWIVAVGAALVVRRPHMPEARGALAVCVALGLVLITGPDQYGPYRLTWPFFLALAIAPPAMLQLTAAFLWQPGRWTGRVVAAMYVVFAALGGALAARRFEPAVFLPLLYIVYCAIANAVLLYMGTLASALVSGQRFRPQVALALAGALVPAVVVIAILVTYPLRTEPVSVPWFIVPIGVWPVFHAIALVKLAPPAAEPGTVP